MLPYGGNGSERVRQYITLNKSFMQRIYLDLILVTIAGQI